jgi:5'-nucleotidase
MYPINATLPSNDLPVADYPLMITQKSGKKVPVLQAFAYTKYLGKVHLIFDKDGNLIEIDGTPILLDKIVPRDEDVIALLNAYRPGIVELETKVLGSTKVELSGKCRTQECNLGLF